MEILKSESHCCRFCGSFLTYTFVDLGMSPLCESYLTSNQLDQMEPFYPLNVYVCHSCLLVQLQEYVSPVEIFSEYAYFSSYSSSWLEHSKNYADMIISRLGLDEKSQVIEIASNDGYLLNYFKDRGIPVLGIEPAGNVATTAIQKGISTRVEFFNEDLAHTLTSEGLGADLLIGNNVLAQIHDLNSFVAGMELLLKPDGVITMEFPHLLQLIEGNQFDTIYHEHFSYFSFFSVEKIFSSHGLKIFDVEELLTHGGSLRIYACRNSSEKHPIRQNVKDLRNLERKKKFDQLPTYLNFEKKVIRTKHKLLTLLINAKSEGKSIAGYGAPGKGNTLLNYCGIRADFLDYTVDLNPYKQGKFLPGSHIPIYSPEKIFETRPDYLLILPWNFKDEIVAQMSGITQWGGKFIIPIPSAEILN